MRKDLFMRTIFFLQIIKINKQLKITSHQQTTWTCLIIILKFIYYVVWD